MLRILLARLTFGLVFGTALVLMMQADSADAAQAAGKPERVKFDTADSVELHGTFYPGNRGNKSPCALLIHPIGENSRKEGWDDLAKGLQEKGFVVLSFDLRGHGDSTSVGPSFWFDPNNITLKSAKSSKAKDKVNYKDFTSQQHYLMMVNDVAAAKRFLDRKNDTSECNSSNLVVVGADSGATLGAMWVNWSWRTRRTIPGVLGEVPTQKMEGQDVICAIWLSISPKLNTYAVPVSEWVRTPPIRDKVPMLFLCGEKDAKAAAFSKQLNDSLTKGMSDKKLKEVSMYKPIKDAKLGGRELLADKSLPAVSHSVEYAFKVVDERGGNAWSKREVEKSLPVRIPPIDRFPR